MSYQDVLREGRGRFEKSIEHLHEAMRGIRTGRASSALVDNIRVDYYGTQTPIRQLASVSIPEPREIIIKPFDPSIIKEMSKAIMKTDLGCSPQNDGKIVRISLPPLSDEQRERYATKIKSMAEETRIALRNTRRELNKQSEGLKKSGDVTEDEDRKLHSEIQDLLKTYEAKVDEALKKKVQEITEG